MFRFIAIALLAAATISMSACAHKEEAKTTTTATKGTKYSK